MEEQVLNAEEVKSIRGKLNLSQTQLARLLGVSLSAVKNWESEDQNRNCGKSSRILLLLMDRTPTIIKLIEELDGEPEQHNGLPNPDALEGTTEWFALQRILFIIGETEFISNKEAIMNSEDIPEEWLDELYVRNLLTPCFANSYPKITRRAKQRFRHDAWLLWTKGKEYLWRQGVQAVPLMTQEELEHFEAVWKERM